MPISGTIGIDNLKARIAVALTLLFILFSFACGYRGERYPEQTIRETVNAGQYSNVASLAQSLDNRLELVQKSLVNAATHLGPERQEQDSGRTLLMSSTFQQGTTDMNRNEAEKEGDP